MQRIHLQNPETLIKIYEAATREVEPPKSVVRGGADLRKFDEAGTKFELVLTYTYRSGRFSKEKTVIAAVPINRAANSLLEVDLSGVTFRALTFKKGNFEEEWSGSIDEARAQFPEVVEVFETDVKALLSKVPHFQP